MEIFLFIFGLFWLLIGGIAVYAERKDNDESDAVGIFICGLLAGSLLIISLYTIMTPSAIDVYRGKTTLEITYRDSIPVDSVVVFK